MTSHGPGYGEIHILVAVTNINIWTAGGNVHVMKGCPNCLLCNYNFWVSGISACSSKPSSVRIVGSRARPKCAIE